MSRLKLHELFVGVLGSRNVYFQPPTNRKIEYPCIKYELANIGETFADNLLYWSKKRYRVTIIDTNPDSLIPDKLSSLPLTTFDRHYTADNLNHYVFLTYF